jgi:hypothetical protein
VTESADVELAGHDPNNHECDLVIYGRSPGARGVICTCDVDGGTPVAATEDAELAPPPAVTRDLVLKGAQATSYARYIEAARRLKAAEAEVKTAAATFREALAAFTDANT